MALNMNKAGITMTAAHAKRDVVKSGHADIPVPRKVKLTSAPLHNDRGQVVT